MLRTNEEIIEDLQKSDTDLGTEAALRIKTLQNKIDLAAVTLRMFRQLENTLHNAIKSYQGVYEQLTE